MSSSSDKAEGSAESVPPEKKGSKKGTVGRSARKRKPSRSSVASSPAASPRPSPAASPRPSDDIEAVDEPALSPLSASEPAGDSPVLSPVNGFHKKTDSQLERVSSRGMEGAWPFAISLSCIAPEPPLHTLYTSHTSSHRPNWGWEAFDHMDRVLQFHLPELEPEPEEEEEDALDTSDLAATSADRGTLSKRKKLWPFTKKTGIICDNEEEFRAFVHSAVDEETARSVLACIDGDPITAAERMEQELKTIEGTPMQHAVELFKKKPAKAVDYMVKEGICEDTHVSIANALYNYRYVLDPVQMGEYLSSNCGVSRESLTRITRLDDESGPEERDYTEILACYVRNISFEHLNFDLALRKFLYSFHLPGEGQRIDRIVRAFAFHYYETFPDTLFNSDIAAYRMAFSVIMLNTDAHNANVFEKMNLKAFVRNCERINDDEDMPYEYLEDMYYRIANESISFTREDARLPDAVRKDWLHVMYSNRMRRRWVALSNNCLLIYRKIDDLKPDKYILLHNVVVVPVCNQKGRRFCVKLQEKTKQTTDVDESKIGSVVLSATSQRDIARWTAAIESCIIKSDVQRSKD